MTSIPLLGARCRQRYRSSLEAQSLTQGLCVAKRALWPQFGVHQIRWALAGQRGQQVFGSQHGH